VLKPETPKVFPLADAAAAHAALEEGNAGGAILLKP
jgi:NADPH2:quinone reductase